MQTGLTAQGRMDYLNMTKDNHQKVPPMQTNAQTPSSVKVSNEQSDIETRKHAQRRQEIIDAARELFEERGLSRTSVKGITDRVGVTRALFYHYFSDKDAVTSAVLDDYIEGYLEALKYWNEGRQRESVEHALESIVRVLRLGIFENDPFHKALVSYGNSALYLEFINRVADRIAKYIVATMPSQGKIHDYKLKHHYETFYVLIIGIVGFLRKHPNTSDEVLKDLITQMLHVERKVEQDPA